MTVQAFATCRVASGWRLRLPALDWVTFHYVVQGDGTLRDAAGNAHPLATNFLAVVPPHLIHAIESGSRVRSEATASTQSQADATLPEHGAGPPAEAQLVVVCGRVHVTYGPSLGLFDQLREVLVLDFSDEPLMRGTFEALLQEHRAGGPGAELMMSALLNQCLVRVLRRLTSHPDGHLPWLTALEDPRLARSMDAMLAHPERRHTVESLAELAYMSRSTFARRFRESFGRTPMDYVREVRLRRGAQLLRSGHTLSIDAIASRVGFASRSQFSHAFHESFGCSPTAFRAEAGLSGGCP